MELTYNKIIRSRGFDLIDSVDDTTDMMMASYAMATDNEHAKINHLIVDFKPTYELSDDLSGAMYQGIFGGSGQQKSRARSFLWHLQQLPKL